ncbi:MAG TPA: two-component system response regulator [Deltaproteobacteria bacterium]|nr:two-component system response regulator [Deltaproteobacteria bacterium]
MNINDNSLILIVEDNDVDYETTIRAFKKSGLSNPVHRCVDGDEALDYLFGRSGASKRSSPLRPGLVLLDLNLPGTDGFQVLKEMKGEDMDARQAVPLKEIPVVVLTTSSDERDIHRCYRAGANSYIQKPVNFDGFVKAMERLKDYWFDVVMLPKADMAR